jgi:hypothetical protein
MSVGRPSTLFEGHPAECVGAVTSRLVYVDFCNSDIIYEPERRKRANSMYFIMSGTVSLHGRGIGALGGADGGGRGDAGGACAALHREAGAARGGGPGGHATGATAARGDGCGSGRV